MTGWAAAVVLIVLIVTIGKVMSRRQGAAHDPGGGDSARLDDEMRRLKDRIAVLERVITDNHGSLGLDREIERLRDRKGE